MSVKEVATIDMTLTPADYRGIAEIFIEDIIKSARKNRRESVEVIMYSLIEIASYLGSVEDKTELFNLKKQIDPRG